MSIIDRDIDNNFTDAIQRSRKSRGFHAGGNWGKILTYPNEIRKSRDVGGEERQQQQPPRSHFRFRFTPPPPPPSVVAAATTAAAVCSSFLSLPFSLSGFFLSSQRNLRHWKTRLDSEFIKMHAASLRIRPEYLPSFTREKRGRIVFWKYHCVADAESVMIEDWGMRKFCENGKAMRRPIESAF